MALIGITKFETEDYICRADPDRTEEAGASIFVLGALTPEQRAFITDKGGSAQEWDENGNPRLVNRFGSRNLEAIRMGLRGWRQFRDKDGNDIPFNTIKRNVNGVIYDIPDNATIAILGVELVTELGEAILERNTMLEGVRKNLNGVAPPPLYSQDTSAQAAPTA